MPFWEQVLTHGVANSYLRDALVMYAVPQLEFAQHKPGHIRTGEVATTNSNNLMLANFALFCCKAKLHVWRIQGNFHITQGHVCRATAGCGDLCTVNDGNHE